MFIRRLNHVRRMLFSALTALAVISMSFGSISPVRAAGAEQQAGTFAIVFVSRKIPAKGSLYYPAGGSLPGTGPYSRFQTAGPGKLLVREANGTIRTLIDDSDSLSIVC